MFQSILLNITYELLIPQLKKHDRDQIAECSLGDTMGLTYAGEG